MTTIIERIAHAFDVLKISRRVGLYFSFWLTWYAVSTAVDLAHLSDLPGIELAAVIAAITAPVTALQGYVIKFNHTYREDKS